MALALAATITLPLAGKICDKCPHSIISLAAVFFFVVGGLIYGCSTELWMLILAQVVIGIGLGNACAVNSSYWGEMTIKGDEIRQEKKKKPLKDVLYVVYLFVFNIAYVMAHGELIIQHEANNIIDV